MTFQETTATSFDAVPPASAASASMTMNHFQQQLQQHQFMLPPQQQQLLLQHQQFLQEQHQQHQYHHHHHHYSVPMPMPTQQSQMTTMMPRMPSLPNVAVSRNSGSIMASASVPVVVGRDQKKPKDEDDFEDDEEHNPNHQTHLPLKKRRIGMAEDGTTASTTTTKTRSSAEEEATKATTTVTELPSSTLSDDERIAALALLTAHEYKSNNNDYKNNIQQTCCVRMTPPPCEPNRQDKQKQHKQRQQKPPSAVSIKSIVPETFSEAAEQTAAQDQQQGQIDDVVPYYNFYNGDPPTNEDTTGTTTTTTTSDVALVTPETLPKKRIREKVISVHPLLEDPYYSLPSTMSSVSLLQSSSSLTSSSPPLTVSTIHDGNTLKDNKKKKILKVKRQRGTLSTAWPDSMASSSKAGSSMIRPSGWNKTITTTVAFAPSKTISFPTNCSNNIGMMSTTASAATSIAPSRQQPQQSRPKRLNVPLPGGCHGVTSRNGGYCRRGPRFNGSLYCKLHYHHYIRTGSPTIGNNQQTMTKTTNHDDEHDELALHVKVSESVSDQETEQHEFSMIGRRGSGLGDQCFETGTALRFQEEEQKKTNNHDNGPVFLPPHPSVQTKNKPKRRRAVKPLDRHYTGNPGEIQCTAVTTRGKKCKYVSVCGTSYCRLHANHDTNPSVPRRRVVDHEEENDDETSSLSLSSSSSSLKDFNTATKIVVVTASKKKTNPKRTTTTTTAKSNIVVGDSFNHIPSLHSLSTDRWYNQRVMIATGPFQNQIGHVERWSNGWVSVRLFESSSKPVVHNRRSFELLLCPDHHHHGAME